MQGGRNKQPLGYTIVEVLIVLAVSSFMFLIAANFINGKQEHTSFIQGVNEMASQLQNLQEQVTDGKYSDVPLTCINTGTGLTINGGVTPSQGTEQDCVFLGKIIHFYSIGAGAQAVNYEIFSMADARSATGQLPNNSVSFIPSNVTSQATTPQNLMVQKVQVTTLTAAGLPGAIKTGAYNFGFAQGLGTVDSAGATDPSAPPYQSGSQNVSLMYAATGFNKTSSQSGNEDSLNMPGGAGGQVTSVYSAQLCLTDDTRYAWIYLGGTANNNDQLAISVKQLGTTAC